jgi:hypothetical protein
MKQGNGDMSDASQSEKGQPEIRARMCSCYHRYIPSSLGSPTYAQAVSKQKSTSYECELFSPSLFAAIWVSVSGSQLAAEL